MRLPALISAATSAVLLALSAGARAEAELALPVPAMRTHSEVGATGTHRIAAGPWRDGALERLAARGRISTEAWRLPGKGGDTGALLEMLEGQLREAGYEVLFQCADAQCGGFDFRFALDVVSEPKMHVDLGDFRYLLARKATESGPAHVALLVSSSPGAGFVQITRIAPADSTLAADAVSDTVTSTMTEPTEAVALPDAPIGAQLEQNGHAVLSDLAFETGSAALGPGPFASLAALADYLRDHPDQRIALVGHTDAEGPLELNVALSRRRAQSVRQRLIAEYGLPEAQLSAEGVGFLSPLDSNRTEDGRTRNRRVEAVITSAGP